MVSLTIFGGIKEIGGNKILLETKEARIFLDFGEAFSLLDEFFLPESFLSPRERFGLKDYVEFGLIPKLEGLYCSQAIERTDIPYKEPEFDAVFLSHSHADHWEHLRFLHPEIPIYMGECTKKILQSTWTTTRETKNYADKCFKTFRSGASIRIKDITVRPIHVDHSVPGAYGFIIDTPEGSIVYTGDLRAHGPRSDMTVEFLDKAASSDPLALIIEGTRVLPEEKRKDFSEEKVLEGSRKALGKARSSLVMRYPKDLDRFRTFYQVAGELGKKLVISRKTAHLLDALKGDEVGLPDPVKDERIEIYGRELRSYSKWEKPYLDKCISPEEIRKGFGKRICEIDFWTLNELIDLVPSNGVLVHSMSEPFEEDPVSLLGGRVLDNWVEHFGLEYHQLHASGHAPKSGIFDMIKQVGAKKVFPVHTLFPELFKESGAKIEIVKKGERREV